MSFQQGLSGLNAASKNLDVIGNNVANSNTIGYKGSDAQFSDVFASSLSGGVNVGIGTALTKVQQQFVQGNISVSNSPLDMAINGNGFFRLSNAGTISFSRNGQFHLDSTGYIVNGAGERLTGYPTNSVGALLTSAPTDLHISSADVPPNPTTKVGGAVNLDSRKGALVSASFDAQNAASYHNATSLSVYDSLGNAHALSVYFVKTGDNQWDVFAANDGTQAGARAIGTLKFDATGAIDTATTTLPFTITAPVATGAVTPMVVEIDFAGSTQFGSAFGVNSLSQDGYASGRLSGYSISADGSILGRYTNGQSQMLGQVVLANFTNPGGLQSLGSNSWAETLDSGLALVGVPGTSSLGAVQSGALEESNTDLTAELVKMITAQRVYQSNAQTIKAQDAVLQTLVNLK